MGEQELIIDLLKLSLKALNFVFLLLRYISGTGMQMVNLAESSLCLNFTYPFVLSDPKQLWLEINWDSIHFYVG